MADQEADPGDNGGKQPIAYEHVEDETFRITLQAKAWVPMYGGLALKGDCPVCHAQNAIDSYVPVVIARFRGQTKSHPQTVECQCSENHHAPTGGVGCGRYARISPQVTGQETAGVE
jgi:hypothetical protein